MWKISPRSIALIGAVFGTLARALARASIHDRRVAGRTLPRPRDMARPSRRFYEVQVPDMQAYPKTHLKAVAAIIFAITVLIAAMPAEERPAQTVPVSLSIEPEPKPAPIAPPPAEVVPEDPWVDVTVRPADSLSRIFERNGLPPADLQRLMTSGPGTKTLKRIMPGQVLSLQKNESGQLQALRYSRSPLDTLVATRADHGFDVFVETVEPELITSFKTGRITANLPSLYHAGKYAGLSDNLIMQLAQIFQWDVSFALDLRQGDAFGVLFEEAYVDGQKIKDGKILAAQFTNSGRTYKAVSYVDNSGQRDFYTPEGASLRKAFLRDPVHFSYVSSSFNPNRLHPVHKRRMPHRGIDYAARTGTPVFASGDGKVMIVRQNNASGKYIVLQHGEQYTTKYLHLSKFAKGIRPGKTVRQGQTIGYVGATGWATGPHLHYEFLVNGVHRNPATVRLPKAKPITVARRAAFEASTAPTLLKLNSLMGHTTFAGLPSDPASSRDG